MLLNLKNEQDELHRKGIAWYCICIISALGLVGCIAILFPPVRWLIISLVEQSLIHGKLGRPDIWFQVLASFVKSGIFCIILFDLLTLTIPGKLFLNKIKNEIKACFAEIDFKAFLKAVLLLSGIYLLGLTSIFRANYLYIDDIGRTIRGYGPWSAMSRYISDFLSIFIYMGINLMDISPLPQILAALIIAGSSVLLVYILCDKKITLLTLLASISVGLSPYFLECLSYKYDAPYMALSVLASIFPFLFIRTKGTFAFCSIISLWIMCMTYQASSGIYVLITIMLTFKDWNCKQKSYKEIVSFAGIAALSFFLAMLSFRFIFMNPFNSYAGTAIFSPAQLISGILRNINNYIILVNNDFNIIWKVFIAVILILFIGKMVGVSAQNKIIAAFGSFFVIAALCIMSFGVYIVLENPLYAPRATYGFGIFLSIISISVISDRKKINMISVLALNWCFLIFSFSYGNALADQKRYTDFRAEMLLRDLSALFPNRTMDDMPIQMRNSIEFAPSIKENIAKRYPVIERLILPQLSNWYWSYHYLIQYFNWGTEELVDRVWDTIALVDFAAMDLPVVFDSFYHTIKSDGEKILIELKN